jgi:hypothetical protein
MAAEAPAEPNALAHNVTEEQQSPIDEQTEEDG